MTELQQLLVLQDLDTKAEQLRYRRAHLAERAALKATDDALAELALRTAESAAAKDVLDRRQEVLDLSVEAMRAKELSLAAQLAKSIVPKEAETLQAEIRGLHQRRSDAEDHELEIMEELDPIEARLAKLAADKNQLEAKQTGQATELSRAEQQVDAELSIVADARLGVVAPLPTAIVARYEKMRGHLNGVAVARLDHGTCLGCNVKLSSTEREALLAAPPDELMECEQCGRLLVR